MPHTLQTSPLFSLDLITGQALLQRLWPGQPPLPDQHVQELLTVAGLWAIHGQLHAPSADLLSRLEQRLQVFREAEPPPSPPSRATPPFVQAVQERAQALGQPFAFGGRFLRASQNLSYRGDMAFLERVHAAQPLVSHLALQGTLQLAYLSWPDFQQRVLSVLRQRTQSLPLHGQDAERVADLLTASGLSWPARSPLPGPVKQVAMHVSLDLSRALRQTLRGLDLNLSDLHTTLLAFYLTDPDLKTQIDTLITARSQYPEEDRT